MTKENLGDELFPKSKITAKEKKKNLKGMVKYDYRDEIVDKVIARLSEVTKHNFRTSGGNKRIIYSRLKEGYKLEELLEVVEWCGKEWVGTKMEIYCRPSTIFGDNFDSHLYSSRKKVEFKKEAIRGTGHICL